MNAQLMEDGTATTRDRRLGGGHLLLPPLLLILAACAPLPPLPHSPDTASAASAVTPEPSNEQSAPIITPSLKPVAPRPVVPQAAAPKPVAPKPESAKPAVSRVKIASKPSPLRETVPAKAVVINQPVAQKPRQHLRSPDKASSASAVAPEPSIEQSAAIITSSLKPVAPRPVVPQAAAPKPVTPKPESAKPAVARVKIASKPSSLSQAAPIRTVVINQPVAKKPRQHLHVESDRVRIGDSQIEMVRLPGGVFQMGSSDGDYDERPLHEVSLRPFSIGRYEVTQQQWMSVMGENPSHFNDCAECPVDSVSWADIQKFLVKLNQLSDRRFRLPSEAEWEYACRAGERDAYCGDGEGDETLIGWYLENSGGRSQPVGRLASNAFGLYDMSGNAYEWVEDCWHGGYSEAPGDGSAWSDGNCQRRVLRGGAWYYTPAYATATYRNANMPDSRFIIYGFRLAHDSE